jgi:hypothetical protein
LETGLLFAAYWKQAHKVVLEALPTSGSAIELLVQSLSWERESKRIAVVPGRVRISEPAQIPMAIPGLIVEGYEVLNGMGIAT